MTTSGGRPTRPTPAELTAARGRSVPDLIAPALDVLFVGINPSLWSAAVGRHFARPGNRFWPALHRAGFTPTLLAPAEQHRLIGLGLGITNLVDRATARADELARVELVAGAAALASKVVRLRPAYVAFLGITAYRDVADDRTARVGPQPTFAGARGWVLPNPSGLNAHYQLTDLGRCFAELRDTVARERGPHS